MTEYVVDSLACHGRHADTRGDGQMQICGGARGQLICLCMICYHAPCYQQHCKVRDFEGRLPSSCTEIQTRTGRTRRQSANAVIGAYAPHLLAARPSVVGRLRAFAAGLFLYMALFELAPPHAHGRVAALGHLIAFSAGLALVVVSETVEDIAVAGIVEDELSAASNLTASI